jgi:hypothetical protein
MSQLEWHRPQDFIFEAGLDRGVLYPEDDLAVPWNGLISVDDSGSSEISNFYLDGIAYLSVVSARDWKGRLAAYTYPDEFAELIGVGKLSDGLFADSQMPGRFGLSYRTMVSAPEVDTEQHYKIHLIYNAMASLGSFSNKTLSSGSAVPTEFSFDLTAVPMRVPQRRPTAHFIVDTRAVDPATIAELEGIIYGTESTDPMLPTIEDLIALLLVSGVVVVYNGDGTWTATGSEDDIRFLDSFSRTFRIDNSSAVWLEVNDVYEFTDAVGEITLGIDEDGTPYLDIGNTEGIVVLQDTDDVYYFDTGVGGFELLEDEDAVVYVVDP